MMKESWTVPERMKGLPRDGRGFPIPVIVQRDSNGLAMFAVNDTRKQVECVKKKLCGICGGRLGKELWFTGGPLSAFHPGGCYADPAMHYECVVFALQVCPYLAMSEYRSKMDAQFKSVRERVRKAGVLDVVDDTVLPDRPKVFVLVQAFGQQVSERPGRRFLVKPLRPYHKVEFWRHGLQLPPAEGLELVRRSHDLQWSDVEAALRLVSASTVDSR